MDIQEYFSKLNSESQNVFTKTILEKEKLGTLHHLASCIFEFSDCLLDPQERQMLVTVSTQLESATLNLTLGLYRQAFSSLRLALEMGLATMYFSVNKMELHEWLDGRTDIKWSKLVDEENGVLSNRFTKAFFSECAPYTSGYRDKAMSTYRKLSEYVHGNNETWGKSGLKVSYNSNLLNLYLESYKNTSEVILFVAICRYTRLLDDAARESLQFIPEEFSHISEVREIFGRS
ncbi:hypothetical protein [Photobacterium sp. Hal280]|uniref:hypothetical protein n=1 Tax=Photobacterium sp. Hal280 TaxID=3035163 RepID=UPI00301D33E2